MTREEAPSGPDADDDAGRDPDEVLAEVLAGPLPGEEGGELLTLEELAERVGLAVSVLEAIEREGLLVARTTEGGERRYAPADADMVRDGLRLLEAGLPLGELLDLARRADEALREVADHAVDLFARFVRDPIRGQASSPEEAADALVTAFRTMLPATGTLVAHHFRRLVVARARERLTAERTGWEPPPDDPAGEHPAPG